MFGYLLLILLFLPLIFLSAMNGKGLVYYILLTSGFPITMLMPGTSIFGINPQAAYLFLIVFAVFLASIRHFKEFLSTLKLNIFFLIFLVYGFISISWTSDYFMALRMFIKLAVPFFFIISVIIFQKCQKDLKIAENIIFCCVALVLLAAVVNNLSGGMLGDARGTAKWIGRNYLTAPYMSPANFSFLLGSGAILALGNYLHQYKVFHLLIYLILVTAICWAFTRISIAGLVAGSSLCFMLMVKSKIIRFAVPAILILSFGAAFFTVDALSDRMFFQDKKVSFSQAIENPAGVFKTINTSGRSHLWGIAKKKFFDKTPIFGSGIGSVDNWLGKNFNSMRLHSEYLRILFELGLFGLILYIVALLWFALKLIIIFRDSAWFDEERKYISVALSALVYYALTLFTDNSLNYVTEFGIYVFSYIGFAHVARNHSTADAVLCGK